MKIVYGWYRAEHEESSDKPQINQNEKKMKEKLATCRFELRLAEL